MTYRSIRAVIVVWALSLMVCSDDEAGFTYDVGYQRTDATTEAPVTVATEAGFDVTIARGYLHIGAVELVACPHLSLEQIWQRLWSTPKAYAHGSTTAVRVSSPFIDNFTHARDTEFDLGTFLPPQSSYCSIKVFFEAADEHADALPDDIDMIGRTFYFEGTWKPQGGTTDTPFTWDSAIEHSVEIELDDPIAIDDDQSQRSGHLSLATDALKWLDATQFDALSDSAQASALLNQIGTTVIPQVTAGH